MATTVISTDLTVTINESYSLNGVDYGNNTVKTFPLKGQVDQRIMNIKSSENHGMK